MVNARGKHLDQGMVNATEKRAPFLLRTLKKTSQNKPNDKKDRVCVVSSAR
jgi:hypothetical protein